jgi:hypothetical protein
MQAWLGKRPKDTKRIPTQQRKQHQLPKSSKEIWIPHSLLSPSSLTDSLLFFCFLSLLILIFFNLREGRREGGREGKGRFKWVGAALLLGHSFPFCVFELRFLSLPVVLI